MERSAIRVGKRCFLGRHHAGLLPPLALIAFSPVLVSTSLFAWPSSCFNESCDSLECRRGSHADIYLQVVRITLGELRPLCAQVEPRLSAKYIPWTFSTVLGYIIRATIYLKVKNVLQLLTILGYKEYGTFASICLMIQETHTTAGVISPTKPVSYDQALGPAPSL